MKIKLGVLFGGVSVEHEISIITSVQAMKAIDKEKYDIIPIYIDKERNMYTGKLLMDMDTYKDINLLKRYAKKVVFYTENGHFYLQSLGLFKKIVNEVDIVFPIVHGSGVEDGSIAGYLNTLGVPFVGPNVLSAALGQDKVVMKDIFKSYNLPIVDYDYHDYLEDIKGDKKNLAGTINFIFVPKLGESIIYKITESELKEKLRCK